MSLLKAEKRFVLCKLSDGMHVANPTEGLLITTDLSVFKFQVDQ